MLVDAVKAAGAHTVTWNADERSGGSYFYRIEADGKVETRRMVVIK
jgi:hypothetical protein